MTFEPESPSRKATSEAKTSTSPADSKSLVTGLVFLALFLLVTGLVISGVTQGFDAYFALLVNHLDLGSGASMLMVLASEYGRGYFWIPVVVLMLIFGKRDTKILAIELAALFVLGIVAGDAMKLLMYRARPFETVSGVISRVPLDTDSSYPSGHAIIVSIGAIFCLARFGKRSKKIASLLALEAGIVCFSRVYVGVHYPLDVVSGIFLAGFIVFEGMYLIEGSLGRQLGALVDLARKILGNGWIAV
jgi:membrane-associated phospholipid phosphatase